MSSELKTLIVKGSWSSVYMWISGDSVSPSFHSNDQKLQDTRGHLSLDCNFSSTGASPLQSCESILDKGPIFDGSQINPIDEARMVLNKTLEDIDDVCTEGLQEAEVVSWLHKSLEDDKRDSSVICFKSAESFYDPYLSEDSLVTKSSLTYATTHEDSSVHRDLECDRTDDWVFLLDLQEDDLQLIPDKGQVSDVFSQPDFPSPTYRINLLNHSSGPRNEETLENVDTEEPLFWPYDSNFCCYPQIEWNGLCISPIKGALRIENTDVFGARKPIRLKVLENNRSFFDKRKSQGQARRNASGSRTEISKLCSSQTGVRSGSTGQSRLAYLNPGGSPLEPDSGQKEKKNHDTKSNLASRNDLVKPLMSEANEIQRPTGVSAESYRELLVRNFGQEKEVPIEKQIGLDEFDGHEGIANVEELEGIQFYLE